MTYNVFGGTLSLTQSVNKLSGKVIAGSGVTVTAAVGQCIWPNTSYKVQANVVKNLRTSRADTSSDWSFMYYEL